MTAPTPEAVRKAIAGVLAEMDICLDPTQWRHPLQLERERETVARWRDTLRSSLLEKGGPDAQEEEGRDALADGGRVDEQGVDPAAAQGKQVDVAQSSPAPAPL